MLRVMRLSGIMLVSSLLWWWQMPGAHAHAVSARIAQMEAPGVVLHDVEIRLRWPEDAPEGLLSVRVGRADVAMLAEPFLQLDWQCPLRRGQGWQCDGPVRSGGQAPLRLAVDLADAAVAVQLDDGPAHIRLRRDGATPDLTRIDLINVPLAWLQSGLTQVWPAARLGAGQLEGEIQVITPADAPLHIETAFILDDAALETGDGVIAAAGIGLQAQLTAAIGAHERHIEASAILHGGEALIANAYLELPQTPVALEIHAQQHGTQGWQLPKLIWRDGDVLDVQGTLGFTADAGLDALNLHLRSSDISPWPERYLSGWLGLAGLTGLQMDGALDVEVNLSADGLERLDARLDAVNLQDPQERFSLNALDAHLTHAVTGQYDGMLRWQSGAIGGIPFGPAHWPLHTHDGMLNLTEPVAVEVLNGRILLHPFRLRLPRAERGVHLDFGLHLQQLDLAPLSAALGWPAFRGHLTGSIPVVRYIGDWLYLDGGLAMAIFDGRIDVTDLVMERPFGVAPTLSVDLTLMNLDLMAITEVFDFGSISGRLDGRVDGLRLLDWRPTAFNAELHTVPGRGVRQRISQRAVQDISSVGGGSALMQSLQGRMIGLFDDFGYRRMRLGCRLLNEVCTMDGLYSAGSGFTIVEGAGLPRLNVVGFNHEVDWPTLVERLTQIADGAAPVVQ